MSATEKKKELDSSSIHTNVSATVSICCSCSSRRPSCKKIWCGFNNYWRLLIMLLVVVFYLLLGAVIFGAVERPNERREVEQVQGNRREATKSLVEILINISNLTEEEARNITPTIIQLGKIASTTIPAEKHSRWDFWSSFFFVSTVITTIGE